MVAITPGVVGISGRLTPGLFDPPRKRDTSGDVRQGHQEMTFSCQSVFSFVFYGPESVEFRPDRVALTGIQGKIGCTFKSLRPGNRRKVCHILPIGAARNRVDPRDFARIFNVPTTDSALNGVWVIRINQRSVLASARNSQMIKEGEYILLYTGIQLLCCDKSTSYKEPTGGRVSQMIEGYTQVP